MKLKRIVFRCLKVISYTALSLFLLFALSVFVKVVTNPSVARAGNAVFYPKFCLGGWDHPQKASGDPELAESSPVTAFTSENSAFLASTVSAQIYCGYFSSEDKTNSPSEVTIAFNWAMPGAVQIVPTPAPQAPVVPAASSGHVQETVQFDSNGPTSITLIENATTSTSTTSSSEIAPVETSTEPSFEVAPAPASEPTPESVGTPASEPSAPVGETGFISRILSFVTSTAHAQSAPTTRSSSPLFDVSYSLDGIRWTSVGTVGEDNWQGYAVQIPVTTWDDLNHLQLTISPLPSIDKRPDMYLESIAARVTYDRTVAESASDAMAAVAEAVDSVATTITNLPLINQIVPEPQKTFITTKTLSFAAHGSPEGLDGKPSPKVVVSSDGASLNILGSCTDKYYVVLMYRNENDFEKDPSSLVANEARKCEDGSFSYNLSSIPSELQSGTFYVLTGEEGDRGPWRATSSPFPVSVVASTTVEEIIQ